METPPKEYGFALKLDFKPDAPHTISVDCMFGVTPILMWAKQISVVYLETLVQRLKIFSPCRIHLLLGLRLISTKPETAEVVYCKSVLEIDQPERFPTLEEEIDELIPEMRREYLAQLESFLLPGIKY